jgi:preprotein translocase subunit Sss1
MNTLTIANKLQNAGLERKPAEEIAQAILHAIEENKKEVANKLETRLLFAGVYIGLGVIGASIGYIFSLLNTIITKLS